MNYLSALNRRLAVRRGSKRATIAVAHKPLIIAYYILRDGTCYSDLGADYFDRLNPEGPAQAINQTARRPGLQSDPGAFSSSRLEVIF
jgi:transposase